MGREPTSTGCHTCRRRRVKCDKARPFCGQCQKSRYECLGYDKILRIQSHGVADATNVGCTRLVKIGEANSYPANKKPNRGDAAIPSDRRSPSKSCCMQQSKAKSPFNSNFGMSWAAVAASKTATQSLVQSPSPSSGLSLQAFVDNITFSYFFDAYSWINMHSILLQDTPMRQHLAQQDDELCYDSLRALAYGTFSRDHQIGGLHRVAAGIYGAMLQKLQGKLATASKSQLAMLIKCIAIMGSYSITVENDLRFAHHRGLARILEHCGPEHFRHSSILPIFESCRFTMLANAIVGRHYTFLEKEEWKIVPWSLHPETKTHNSKLIDVMMHIPGIILRCDSVLNERAQWVLGGYDIVREETPETLPNLQRDLAAISQELKEWQSSWVNSNGYKASHIIHWALSRIGDDSYRPGIWGVQGPDAYAFNLGDSAELDTLLVDEPVANTATFSLMQEVSLYITALIWVGRLNKSLLRAAQAPDCVDFYTAPFFTTCRCYYDNPNPSERRCQSAPEPLDHVDARLAWNVGSAKISECPIKSLQDNWSDVPSNVTQASEFSESDFSETESTCHEKMFLPGDVRFTGQLRILNWLIKSLPTSRAYVLGTLAAIGLSHCIHDVRPSEGSEIVAKTVRETMVKSKFDGAAELLLKKYR